MASRPRSFQSTKLPLAGPPSPAAAFSRASSEPERSWPAQKCLPTERSTITLTSASSAARVKHSSISSRVRPLTALAFSGRFRVITATRSSVS